MIGNCGTGKSSLIGLLSGNFAKTCAGPKRGTSVVSTIKSAFEENVYFVDTVGLQDASADWTDPVLLRKTLQYVHHHGFKRVKIILTVSGDTKTRAGPFTRPAQFIGILKVTPKLAPNTTSYNVTDEGDEVHNAEEGSNDDGNYENVHRPPSNPTVVESDEESEDDGDDRNLCVWDSVLVIKKEGCPENVADVSGVMAAAMDNGATKHFSRDAHVFGFTCTEWQFDAEDLRYKFIPEEKRQELRHTCN